MLDFIGENKRKYERVRLQYEIRYRDQGSQGDFRDSMTVDISASGCQFQAGHTLGISEILELEIHIPTLREVPFLIEARVMRMEEVIRNEQQRDKSRLSRD